MMENIQLVVLLAGKSTRLYPLTLTTPKSILSLNNRPFIFNMITPLIKKGIKDIIFVTSMENNYPIKTLIDYNFNNSDLNIHYIIQKKLDGPGGAFKLASKYINKPVLLLLGDTLCDIPENFNQSWIGVKDVDKSTISNWCMVEHKNNRILNLIDKPVDKVKTNYAAIGIYFFKNYKLLKEALKRKHISSENEFQLSTIFYHYMKKENLYIQKMNYWIDIGTLENYNNANLNLFNSRSFNNLSANNNGQVTKISDYEKISSEIKWFDDVKDTDYSSLTPKIYQTNKKNYYTMELYDYLTLSEFFVYYPISDTNIKYIFNNLLNTLYNIFLTSKKEIDIKTNAHQIYYQKTISRIKKWNRSDLLEKEKIIINGIPLKGIYQSLNLLESAIQQLINSSNDYISIIHGDLAFTNILISFKSLLFKFIDPRGNWGIDTIYGDFRYDLAKLRHCYHGHYDEIINDLFSITENLEKQELKLSFYKKENLQYSLIDKIIEEKGFNIDDIELIEALLFISMIPLHDDEPKRQLAFFVQGLKILNRQLTKRKLN